MQNEYFMSKMTAVLEKNLNIRYPVSKKINCSIQWAMDNLFILHHMHSVSLLCEKSKLLNEFVYFLALGSHFFGQGS